jgi:hypothetical protein
LAAGWQEAIDDKSHDGQATKKPHGSLLTEVPTYDHRTYSTDYEQCYIEESELKATVTKQTCDKAVPPNTGHD